MSFPLPRGGGGDDGDDLLLTIVVYPFCDLLVIYISNMQSKWSLILVNRQAHAKQGYTPRHLNKLTNDMFFLVDALNTSKKYQRQSASRSLKRCNKEIMFRKKFWTPIFGRWDSFCIFKCPTSPKQPSPSRLARAYPEHGKSNWINLCQWCFVKVDWLDMTWCQALKEAKCHCFISMNLLNLKKMDISILMFMIQTCMFMPLPLRCFNYNLRMLEQWTKSAKPLQLTNTNASENQQNLCN